jgi:hypothetical protein
MRLKCCRYISFSFICQTTNLFINNGPLRYRNVSPVIENKTRSPVARDYTTRDFVLSVHAHSLINRGNSDEKKIKIHSIYNFYVIF